MTQDAWQSGKNTHNLWMQFAYQLSLAAWLPQTALRQHEDNGQKLQDSPDFTKTEQWQLEVWIAQLRMVIRHKPWCYGEEKSKMRYAFGLWRVIALWQIITHTQDDGTIELANLPDVI